ncbi:MAG: fibronectin type III-like domain-contianing protein, partial [Sphingobium sp.]
QTASVTRPIKQLKGFKRVSLAPGETKTVRITLGPSAFSLWNLDMEEVVEPGLFDIMVGPDSENLQTIPLEVI